MGTVAVYKNIRIVIHTRDHSPPHVHAIGPDAEAVINLITMEVIQVNGFDARSVKQIQQFIWVRKAMLLEAWNEIHKN